MVIGENNVPTPSSNTCQGLKPQTLTTYQFLNIQHRDTGLHGVSQRKINLKLCVTLWYSVNSVLKTV